MPYCAQPAQPSPLGPRGLAKSPPCATLRAGTAPACGSPVAAGLWLTLLLSACVSIRAWCAERLAFPEVCSRHWRGCGGSGAVESERGR